MNGIGNAQKFETETQSQRIKLYKLYDKDENIFYYCNSTVHYI